MVASSALSTRDMRNADVSLPDAGGPTVRVLYDHQVFSRQSAGGASRYFCEAWLRELSATTKVELELLVGVSATVYPLRDLSAASTRVRACRGPNLGGAWNYVVNEAFGNCVAPFLGKMDVYHPTLYRVMPGVRARSVVATHHDCTQERFPQEFRYVDKVMRAKKSLYAQADGIICVSEWCRKELLDMLPASISRRPASSTTGLRVCRSAPGRSRGSGRK